MKIVATSDLHGFLPEIPECDLLILAGDICPVTNHSTGFQAMWLHERFNKWLKQQPAKHKVAVLGNHDLVGEERPEMLVGLDWTLLQDELVEIDGMRIYGLPWTRTFGVGWAYNLDEPELEKKYEAIPECDIIVSHGPPFGHGDAAPRENGGIENVGSPAFLKRIEELQPKLVVYGHIHEGSNSGQWIGKSCCANVTHVDSRYRPVYKPFVYDSGFVVQAFNGPPSYSAHPTPEYTLGI